MNNIPVIKIGIVAVSRDCFPESLAVNRRKAVIAEYEKKYGKEGIYECPICIVESEIHAQRCQHQQDTGKSYHDLLPDHPLFHRKVSGK